MIEVNPSSLDKAALIAALGGVVMRWQDATQKFDETVGERYGLSASERLCLSAIWPDPQPASVIARQARLTPAAVTALIDRLEKRGFVRRRPDANDRRKVLVEAGDAARRLTEEVYLPLGRDGAKMLEQFSLGELQVAAKVMLATLHLQESHTEALLARPAPKTR